MGRIDPDGLTLKEKVVFINRVAKVVKGGRRFSFTALVVVGGGDGIVGMGKGKATEVPEAIKKAVEQAKKSLISFPVINGTIPHRITGKFGAGAIVINPGAKGTGIIAGGAVRALFEVAGVQDIVAKSIRSHNPFNTVKATIEGLKLLRDPDMVLKIRGRNTEEAQQEVTA